MSLLDDTIKNIKAPVFHGEKAGARVSDFSALGALSEMFKKYAAITGQKNPEIPKKCVIIACADHGVSEMNVSAYPPSTTLQMTANYLLSQGGTANALANFAGAELLVADLGIAADTDWIPGLIRRKIGFGTKNFTKGPAMTREDAVKSLEVGIELSAKCAGEGVRCFLPGEMGIANTTSSAAIVAAVCGLTPEEATGRGTNISDERLKVKIEVVRKALEVNRPDPKDGIDLLSKVGGFELGCIAGIILGAAANGAFVVLDGFNTGAAALIAAAISPEVSHYLMGSHLAAEPAHRAALAKLKISPYMDMKFRLGEATGSSLAANLLDAATRVFNPSEDGEKFFFDGREMPPKSPPATEKTFDFYLKTFPSLSKPAMESARFRLDNLTKPIHSLGYLEEIAVELAGILDEDFPPLDLPRKLLVFDRGNMSDEQRFITGAFAAHGGASVKIARMRGDRSPAEAFNFGREVAEDITLSAPILGLALTEESPEDPFGTKAKIMREALIKGDGGLRYDPHDFLAKAPENLRRDVSALLGAMIAGAHNSAMIVLDDESTEIVARYAEALCPELSPYVLHVQPALLNLGIVAPGGAVASLGFSVIDAALHVINDMKTFAEAKVPVAGDGPGAGRQVEK